MAPKSSFRALVKNSSENEDTDRSSSDESALIPVTYNPRPSLDIYSMEVSSIADIDRLTKVMMNEIKLHRKFVMTKASEFPVKTTFKYNSEKARRVCRQKSFTELWKLSVPANKTTERFMNNQKSLQSRYKQKMARINDSLSVLFLRKRVAEYESRIERMLGVMMDIGAQNPPPPTSVIQYAYPSPSPSPSPSTSSTSSSMSSPNQAGFSTPSTSSTPYSSIH